MDDIHDMMDDIDEQTQLAQEISDCISNPVGFGNDVDEVSLHCYLTEFVRIRLIMNTVGTTMDWVILANIWASLSNVVSSNNSVPLIYLIARTD